MIIKRLLTFALVLGAFYVSAQKIPFQGKLTENDEPVTGTKTFVFGFPTIEWEETHEDVSILDGYYSVILGSVTPIPDSLFDASGEVELSISVDGTALSSVMIYAPIGSKTGRFVITESTDTTTTALTVLNNSTGTSFGTGSRIGAYIEAKGEGLNTGLFSYAENGRSINNQSELTDPEAYVTSQLSSLYGNSNVGGRAMQAQYTATGGGHGIGVSAYAGGGGMNWALWGRANSVQSDSSQFGAYIEAYGPGTGEHIGVRGIASGTETQKNIGIHGMAYNSPGENWAGWFDGSVNVNGELIVNGSAIGGEVSNLDSIQSKDVQLIGEDGLMKANLNIYNGSGSLVLNSPNDSTKVILGSAYGNYGSGLYLYDSLRNQGARLRTSPNGVGNLNLFDEFHNVAAWIGNASSTGGFTQLVGHNPDGTFSGATLTGFASWNNNLPYFFMEGSSEDPYVQLIQFGLNTNSLGEGAYFNMNTSTRSIAGLPNLVNISTSNDDGGSDPDGESGLLELWGDQSINFVLQGKGWQDNDLASLTMFSSKDDGSGWYFDAGKMEVNQTLSGEDYGDFNLYSTNSGVNRHTVYLTGSLFESGGGGLELRDASEVTRVSLNGNDGNISANRTDGGSAANFFVASDNGGISIQNAAGDGKLFYEGGSNQLTLRNDTLATSFLADGTSGDLMVLGTVTSQGNVLSSDRRYKRDIQTLEGALDKTKQLRGTSYYWKDKNRGSDKQIGVIAQEVEEVYPEFVHTNADGYKAVNYAQMVAVLIEAVKELDAKVASLEKENGELKAELAAKDNSEIESLKSEIESIKQILSLNIDKTESVGTNK